MKKSFLTLLGLLIISACAFGQDLTYSVQEAHEPLFVLIAEDKTIEVHPSGGDTLSASMIKSEWIESINVLKGDDAVSAHGDLGKNGVVIIKFKSYSILSDEIHALFERKK